MLPFFFAWMTMSAIDSPQEVEEKKDKEEKKLGDEYEVIIRKKEKDKDEEKK